MRIWSIHPSYLDSKGLVAAWREGLLALKVLKGETKGYKNHPQLLRFKTSSDPLTAISIYLHALADEADTRHYAFKRETLAPKDTLKLEFLTVTSGQLMYETKHLKKKLSIRDQEKFLEYESIEQFKAHPLFKEIPGEVENWEVISPD